MKHRLNTDKNGQKGIRPENQPPLIRVKSVAG